MSGTEYARPEILRMTADERHTLARAVMRSIEVVSADLASGITYYGEANWREPLAEVSAELARLRSLLERLTD